MADRTVKVNLVADVSDYTAGLAKAAAATRTLGDDIGKQTKPALRKAGQDGGEAFTDGINRGVGKAAPRIRKTGQEAGGTLSQGINQGLIRNSPLIVAGVAGALSAGAPAVLAGAGVMFAGVGAAAASQIGEVRTAWKNLGAELQAASAEDAAVLIPTITGAASRIGDAFTALRPTIREAFGESAPQIDSLVGSILTAANDAVPALARAVSNGAPVMDALGHTVEQIGTGLAGFLDAISSHSDDAATSLAAIGDILGALLPTLGELLGTGSSLASVVLPPLADALQTVADVAKDLGPLLPMLVTGFTALRAVKGLGGAFGNLSEGLLSVATNLDTTATKGGRFSGAAGKLSNSALGMAGSMESASRGIGGVATALPALGIVLGGIAQSHSDATSKEEEWAQAILAGGEASKQAYENYQSGTHWGQSVDEATGLAGSWSEARDRANELRAQMTPLQIAQANVTTEQNNLAAAVANSEPGSLRATEAAQRYKAAQAELARQEGLTQQAISGVTQAMIDQANQVLASTNSSFAYRQAQDDVQGAEEDLAAAIKEHGRQSEAASDAGLALERALFAQATAAGQLASDALPATATELDKNRAAASGTLTELYNLRAEMGDRFPASLQTAITNLEKTGGATQRTGETAQSVAGHMKDLGLAVLGIPDDKHVEIKAPTADQQKRLDTLGYTVETLPDGRIVVSAKTSAAYAAMSGLANYVNTFINGPHTITVDANLGPARSRLQTLEREMRSRGVYSASGGSSRPGGPGYATGGVVRGPGSGTSDSVRARLSDGEFVIRAAAAKEYGTAMLAAINERRFAGGGNVGREFTGRSAGPAASSVTVTGARLVGTLDLGNGLTGQIDARVAEAFTSVADSLHYAGA